MNKKLWTKVKREIARAKRRYLARLNQFGIDWEESTKRNRIAETVADNYAASALASETDTYLLVRIIGNDLEPRHTKGQSAANLKFILDHESQLDGCSRLWIVNRIVEADVEQHIIGLLEKYGQEFVRVPFDLNTYARADWDFSRFKPEEMRFAGAFGTDPKATVRYETEIRRLKNIYLMNNNGARNLALKIGRQRAKWVLPWDGNCFVTVNAWRNLCAAIQAKPYLPYVIVPMARLSENADVLKAGFKPSANEEPQIVFRRDTNDLFDESFPYGRRPKIEMLWRLGVPGGWSRLQNDKWDMPRPPKVELSGMFQFAGWVARLSSGNTSMEVGKKSDVLRGESRDKAIITMLNRVDTLVVEKRLISDRLAYYDDDKISALGKTRSYAAQRLWSLANGLTCTSTPSFANETALPQSGDLQDCFYPASHKWPNPEDGPPSARRDRAQLHDTELFGPTNNKHDHTRPQRLLTETTILALASAAFNERRFGEAAAQRVRAWFAEPPTSVNPHMKDAQANAKKSEGVATKISEYRDIAFLLDGVRLLERGGLINVGERQAFRTWVSRYAVWLDTDSDAQSVFCFPNNQAIFFDVQRTAIATFLGDTATLAKYMIFARERLANQIAHDGSLPAELSSSRPFHCVLSALQGWTTLARILSNVGDDLWNHRTQHNDGIRGALGWIMENWKDTFQTAADQTTSPKRLGPLLLDMRRKYATAGYDALISDALSEPLFHPGDGIAPFWFLSRD